MKPKLTELLTGKRAGTGEHTIRAAFSNDRHYEVVIQHPAESEQVAQALFDMADMIARDPHLRPKLNGTQPMNCGTLPQNCGTS